MMSLEVVSSACILRTSWCLDLVCSVSSTAYDLCWYPEASLRIPYGYILSCIEGCSLWSCSAIMISLRFVYSVVKCFLWEVLRLFGSEVAVAGLRFG